MAKVVDITDKLNFEENPKLLVKDVEIEVNSDATTVLKLMGVLGEDKTTAKDLSKAYELIFSEESREKIEGLNMSFNDLTTVIGTAIDLITGDDDQGSSDPYYDLIDDFDLVIASFQSQYGMRLSRELKTMKWDEFRDLLVGISPETPLGRIVAIRSEEDPEVLKHFTKEQHRIRNKWRSKKAKKITQADMHDILESFKNAFISMAGG